MTPSTFERSAPCAWERSTTGDGLTLSGYAAVFDEVTRIDSFEGRFDEVIQRGAFRKTLSERTPVLMFEHGKHPTIGSMPIGRITRAAEDGKGLHVQARLHSNALIEPVREAIESGAVDGMSFRFAVAPNGDTWQNRGSDVPLRTLRELEVPELGPVVFPAYAGTAVAVRSIPRIGATAPTPHGAIMSDYQSATDLRAERDRLVAEVRTITESGNLTDGQRQRVENLEAGIAKVETRLAERIREDEQRAARSAEMLDYARRTPGAVVSGDGARFNAPQVMHRVDPWGGESEERDRAFAAVERAEGATDEARQAATRLLDRAPADPDHLTGVERHIADTSHPDYVGAFRKYLMSPTGWRGMLTQAEEGAVARVERWNARTAMSLTAGNGGVLVPQFLDPTITLTNAGSDNAIREISGNAQITVDQWDGVNSAGMTAEWLAEGTEAADASPTFTGPTITVHKASAYAFGSFEVLMDSGFEEFPVLVADAKDRLEETAFTTGNGSGQPWGLISRLSGTGPTLAGSSGAAGAADLVLADLYALDNGLPARWRRNASWMAHHTTWNQTRQLISALPSDSSIWNDYGAGTPSTLLGRSVYEDEAMDSTRVSGSNDDIILYGDFARGYKIVDRIGMQIAHVPVVLGASQRPTGQAGFFAFWRVGADVITSNAFRLLRI